MEGIAWWVARFPKGRNGLPKKRRESAGGDVMVTASQSVTMTAPCCLNSGVFSPCSELYQRIHLLRTVRALIARAG
eukprot:2210241-Rhodomonas_salina.2